MDIMEKYNEYPYKRVFSSAEAYGYPLSIVEKIMQCYEKVPNNEINNKEILAKLVICGLEYHLGYSYTNEEEFLNKVYELRKFVQNIGSSFDTATIFVANNYILNAN